LVTVAFLAGSFAAQERSTSVPDQEMGFVAPLPPLEPPALRRSDAATTQRASVDATPTGTALSTAAGVCVLASFAVSLARNQRRQRTAIRLRATKLEDLNVGDEVEGVVDRVAKVGVWIDIGAEKSALLPKDEVKKQEFDKGQTVRGLIISEVQAGATPAERKIRLSLSKPMSSLNVGDILDGTVTNATKFGIFFDVGLSENVLVPTRLLAKGDEELQPQEKRKVKLIEIEDSGRITGATDLSIEGQAKADLKQGDKVTGTVRSIVEFGIFVTLTGGVDALIRTNQLEKAIDTYKEGDELPDLRVVVVDDGKIACSQRPFPSEMNEGDKLEATVTNIATFGVFMDAGLAFDVLAPNRFLSKPAEEYTVGEVVDVVIKQIDGDKISVDTRGDSPLGSIIRGTQVTGKVLRTTQAGVFLDVGLGANALLRERSLPKPISEYAQDEVVDKLIVLEVDEERELIIVGSMEAPLVVGIPLTDLEIGQEVTGTVKRVADFGVFVDIGAERDALYQASQIDGQPSDFKAGQELTGLKVVSVDIQQNRLAVSMKKMAGDFTVGEEITGRVSKKMSFGVFVDIGASQDALLPQNLMSKPLADVTAGEEITAKVIDTTPSQNKITLGQQERAELQSLVSEKRTIQELKIGEKIEGVVRMSRDYGVFVDIGCARRDALLPASQLPDDRAPGFYKPQDSIEVYIGAVDLGQERITLCLEPPPEGGIGKPGTGMAFGGMVGGEVPKGEQLPDVEYWRALNGLKEDEFDGQFASVEDEPVNWEEWEKKYPGFVVFAEKEMELYGPAWAPNFQAGIMARTADLHHIPVPEHLRRPDAGPAEIPATDFNDYPMTYDYGIKPEIHIKYMQPPYNDPNWLHPGVKPELVEKEWAKIRAASGQPAEVEPAEASEGEA